MRMAKFLMWTSPVPFWIGAVEAVRWSIKGVSLGDAFGIFTAWFLVFIAQIVVAVVCYMVEDEQEQRMRRI